MPFDGQPSDYEVKKPDVFSLEGLIAWLETQDPATEYDYWDCRGECLISRYLTASGVAGSYSLAYTSFMDDLTRHSVAAVKPNTYGAALDRARALQQVHGRRHASRARQISVR